MADAILIMLVVAFIVGVLIMRWLGAWMLRINEVIALLDEIRKELTHARLEREKEKQV